MWMVHEDGVAPDAVGGSDSDSDSGDDDDYY